MLLCYALVLICWFTLIGLLCLFPELLFAEVHFFVKMTTNNNLINFKLNDIADFGDVDFLNEDIEWDRFVFLEEGEWANLVEAKFQPSTMKKLRYVEELFED